MDSKPEAELILKSAVVGGTSDVLKRLTDKHNDRVSVQQPKAAWTDEDDSDDDELTELLGRRKKPSNNSVQYSAPRWASTTGGVQSNLASDEEDDETHEVNRFLDAKESSSLGQGVLTFVQQKDLVHGCSGRTMLSSIEFSRTAKVALVAGNEQRLSIFQIDGNKNPLLQKIAFDEFTLDCAHFSADGSKIFVSSRIAPHYYYYDMLAGKIVKVNSGRKDRQWKFRSFKVSPDGSYLAFQGRFGYIYLYSGKTFELLHALKMNCEVSAIDFSSDGSLLYSVGESDQVCIWDCALRRCVHQFRDEGTIKATSLAVSRKYVACGSNTGVVNLYNSLECRTSNQPKPLKSFMNLRTEIANLKLNETEELLAFSSPLKRNSFRFAHVRSTTVFENFPSATMSLGNVRCFDFSRNSGFFAMSNSVGQVQLYRLPHYKDY